MVTGFIAFRNKRFPPWATNNLLVSPDFIRALIAHSLSSRPRLWAHVSRPPRRCQVRNTPPACTIILLPLPPFLRESSPSWMRVHHILVLLVAAPPFFSVPRGRLPNQPSCPCRFVSLCFFPRTVWGISPNPPPLALNRSSPPPQLVAHVS